MSVPETAVNEDDRLIFRQDDIGRAGKVFPMQSEPVSHQVEKFSNDKLRFSVLTLHGGHYFAAFFLVENVGHLKVVS